MFYVVIGDVHGMLRELQALVKLINPSKSDVLLFLGDLIDKGPDSDGVISYVRYLSKRRKVIIVPGNHEEKYFRMMRQGKVPDTILSYDNHKWLSETMERAPFYKFWDYIVVHGGIYPAFYSHYQAIPNLDTIEEWPKKLRERVQRFDKIRYVNPEGNMVALGQETSDDVFWAEEYDGRDGFAIYGHQPWKEVKYHSHAMGIDTGCVLGNRLTGFIVEEAHSLPLVCSVPASRAYAEFF